MQLARFGDLVIDDPGGDIQLDLEVSGTMSWGESVTLLERLEGRDVLDLVEVLTDWCERRGVKR
jgi:hypothetical protein